MAFTSPPPFNLSFSSSSSWQPTSSNSFVVSRRRRQTAEIAFAIPNPFSPSNRYVTVRDIKIIRAKKLPNTVVNQYLMPLKGRRVSVKVIHDAVQRVNQWFIDNYYICSRLVIIHLPGLFDGNLVFFSAEPRLKEIQCMAVDKQDKPIEGAVIRTRENTIANAVGLHRGDVFSWKPDGFARLLALDIFQYANAEVKVVDNDNVNLILYLREQASSRIEPGAGLTSDGRFYGDVSISDNNFMGRAQRLRIAWQKKIDFSKSAGGIAFEDMRVGARIPLSFKIRAYRDSNSGRRIPRGTVTRNLMDSIRSPDRTELGQESSSTHEKDRDGILVDVGYRPKNTNLMLNISPIFEVIHPHSGDFLEEQSVYQLLASTSITHATRLPVDVPRSGHLVRVEQSVGNTLNNTRDTFRRTVLRLSQYFKVGKTCSIAIGSNIGLGSDNLPWHEQKSLGGGPTVRGYGYGELGRYKSFATGRMEFRVPLSGYTSNDAEEEQKEYEEKLSSTSSSNIIPSGILDKLPPLVGVIFADVGAMIENKQVELVGSTYGLGIRIGGVFTAEWISSGDGKASGIHLGLVDRSL